PVALHAEHHARPSDPVAHPRRGTTGPNLIGQFVEHPRERYDARYVRADSLGGRTVDVVALTPREQDQPYREAVIWVDREDGLVRRIDLTETAGQQRTVILDNIQVNRGARARPRGLPRSRLRGTAD